MKNQYEIDYQQGYDKANEEWLDRIDKIRAEIEEYRDSMRWNSESLIKWEAINYVLEHIIDKYKAESEK